jgi:hypothetical protein
MGLSDFETIAAPFIFFGLLFGVVILISAIFGNIDED